MKGTTGYAATCHKQQQINLSIGLVWLHNNKNEVWKDTGDLRSIYVFTDVPF